jgi:hypothetical protein
MKLKALSKILPLAEGRTHIQTTRITNGGGGVVTNVQKAVTSKNQFFTDSELIFTARPIFVTVHNDQLTTTSAYGWRANFGPARDPVEPDVYRTMPGAVVDEGGTGNRIVPISATLTFDFSTMPPSLTAVMPNAVLEGRAPSPPDGTKLLRVPAHQRDLQVFGRLPSGALPSRVPIWIRLGLLHAGGRSCGVEWNSLLEWRAYLVPFFSNLALLPQAQLRLTRVGATTVQASWRTNFSDYVLECASTLPNDGWSIVTNIPTTTANRLSVTLDMETPQRFYRLRKP